jgi:arylsulfatase A-like enzyme
MKEFTPSPIFMNQERPDVIWILTDQQSRWFGPDGLGPATRKLAQEGATVDVCQCAAPVCGPSRTSLFSGLPVHSHGLIYNDWGEKFGKAQWENRGLISAGQRFHDAGFFSRYFGKWHAGEFHPEAADAIPGFLNDSGNVAGRTELGWDMDATWTDRAIKALQQQREDPLFLVLSLHNPHDICYHILNYFPEVWQEVVGQLGDLPPLPDNFEIPTNELELAARLRRLPKDPNRPGGREMLQTELWDEARWRQYLGVYQFLVEKADVEIGRFLEVLDSTERGRSAFVAYTSDHGEGMAAHKLVAKQSPYRESMEVPLVFRWQGHIPAGVTERRIVADGLDLLPTSLAAAGLPHEDLPGRALSFLWSDESPIPARDFSVAELFPALAESDVAGRILRAPDLKYVFATGGGGEEGACTPSTDPGEATLGTGSGSREQLKQARALLESWMESHSDPLLPQFREFCQNTPPGHNPSSA